MRAAVERLQPLGVDEPHVEAARDIHGDVLAADGDGVDMDETAVAEHAHADGAAAEIEHGRAELGFVVDQDGEARRIGRGDHGLDGQVAALDCEQEIAAAAAASALTTWRSAPSLSPIMPLGSRMPPAPSSEKPMGRLCRTARPVLRRAQAGRLQHPVDVAFGRRRSPSGTLAR